MLTLNCTVVPHLCEVALHKMQFIQDLGRDLAVIGQAFASDAVENEDRTVILCCYASEAIVFAAYVIEVAFQPRMRPYLVIHHLITTFFIFLTFPFAAEYVEDGLFTPYVRISLIMGFHFSTEQTIFVAMLLRVFAKKTEVESQRRRLFWWSAFMMLLSVGQTLLIKIPAAAGAMALVVKYVFLKDKFWNKRGSTILFGVFAFVANILLVTVQLYAAYIYFCIYRSTHRHYLSNRKEKTGLQAGTKTDNSRAPPHPLHIPRTIHSECAAHWA